MIRLMTSLFSLGALVLGTVSACSGGDEKDPYATANDFCAAWSERACNTDVVNNCSQEGGEKASCRASQKAFCKTLLGDAKYRRDAAEECLAFVKSAYADAELRASEAAVVLKLGSPCAQVVGRGGELCERDSDCSDGVCETDDAGIGTCRIAGGFRCDPGGEVTCASEFYCNDRDICEVRGSTGDTCESDGQCASNQRCKITVVEADPDADPPVEESTSGECVARLATGEDCEQDDECQSRWCLDGECTVRVILSDQTSICDALQ